MKKDYCPNEKLANLKAEAEGELECEIENMYIQPVVYDNNNYLFKHNAQDYILSSKSNTTFHSCLNKLFIYVDYTYYTSIPKNMG